MYRLMLNVVMLFYINNILCHHSKKEGRLLMSPVELIDLVQEEQKKNKAPSESLLVSNEEPEDQEDTIEQVDPEPEEELCEDAKTLKNRKIWSRWSRWSECSVTCGAGNIERHRVCVAGRCAHGEREEQHRPCSRQPCHSPDNFTDEMREFE